MNSPPSPWQIGVVHPKPHHQSCEPSTLLMGCVRFEGNPFKQPLEQLSLVATWRSGLHQDVVIPLSASGRFSEKLPLHSGQNTITLRLLNGENKTHALAETTLTVERWSAASWLEKPEILSPMPTGPKAPDEGERPRLLWLDPVWEQEIETYPGSQYFFRALLDFSAVQGGTLPEVFLYFSDSSIPPMPLCHVSPGDPAWDNRTSIFAEKHHLIPPFPETGLVCGWVPTEEIQEYLGQNGSKHLEKLSLQLGCRWQGENSSGSETCWPVPATLLLFPKRQLARVSQDKAIVRQAPVNGQRLTPLPAGTMVWCQGKEQGWVRLIEQGQGIGWLAIEDVTFPTHAEGFNALRPPVSVEAVHIRGEHATGSALEAFPESLTVFIPLQAPIPFHLEASSSQLTLTLYGAINACDFVHLVPTSLARWIESTHVQTTAAGHTCLSLCLLNQNSGTIFPFSHRRPLICGYYYRYGLQARDTGDVFGLEVTLRLLPEDPKDWVVLLDAGHGGEEWGAIACDGTPEKTLNLAACAQLRHILENAGLTVYQTRQDDTFWSLQDRGDFLERRVSEKDSKTSQAPHFVVSVHHNALPDGRTPQLAKGVSTYYYHRFALPWATSVQTWLLQHVTPNMNQSVSFASNPNTFPFSSGNITGNITSCTPIPLSSPDYGILYDSLSMTRLHHAIALLVELSFLTDLTDALPHQDERA